MPTAWMPWPGKMKAVVMLSKSSCSYDVSSLAAALTLLGRLKSSIAGEVIGMSGSIQSDWLAQTAADACISRLLLVRPEAERMAGSSFERPAGSALDPPSRVSAFDEILSGLIQGSEGSAPSEAG